MYLFHFPTRGTILHFQIHCCWKHLFYCCFVCPWETILRKQRDLAFSSLVIGVEFRASVILGSTTEMKQVISIVTSLPWDVSDGKIYKPVDNSLTKRDIIRSLSIISGYLQTFMGYWEAFTTWSQIVNRGTGFHHIVCACTYHKPFYYTDSCNSWEKYSNGR